MINENIINILAMLFSLAGMMTLIQVSLLIGGSIGRMIKYIVVGIFFSVFTHAGFELASSYGIIGTDALLEIMGLLLILGAISFIIGAYITLKDLKR